MSCLTVGLMLAHYLETSEQWQLFEQCRQTTFLLCLVLVVWACYHLYWGQFYFCITEVIMQISMIIQLEHMEPVMCFLSNITQKVLPCWRTVSKVETRRKRNLREVKVTVNWSEVETLLKKSSAQHSCCIFVIKHLQNASLFTREVFQECWPDKKS